MAKQKNKKKTEESSSIRPNEFVSAIQQIAEEKGISDGKVIETIEASLAAAYKKDYGKKGQNIRSEFNRKDGTAKFFLVKKVVRIKKKARRRREKKRKKRKKKLKLRKFLKAKLRSYHGLILNGISC